MTGQLTGQMTGSLIGGVVASSLAAAALLLPWVALGRREFSSLDIISTASALEIIEGRQKHIVVACWMIIPVLVAVGYVLAATAHRRAFACSLLPLGPIYLAAILGISSNTPVVVRWGLQLGVVAGVVSTLLGVLILIRASRQPAQ